MPLTGRAAQARVGVRRARQVLRDLRPAPGWDAPQGPVVVGGARVELHTPRVQDAAEWTALRLACRADLEPWWPAGDHWPAEQTELAWNERCARLRSAARRGAALPGVLRVDGSLRGEVGVDAVDLGTSTGELSFWVDTAAVPTGTAVVATALVCRRALAVEGIDRLVAPVAVHNPRPRTLLSTLGFEREATFLAYRWTSAGRSDHDMFVLHGGPAAQQRLRQVLAELSAPGR